MRAAFWPRITVAFTTIWRTDRATYAGNWSSNLARTNNMSTDQSQLKTGQLPFEEKPLHVPTLEELQQGVYKIKGVARFVWE